jgi:hypothetical protein
MSIYDMCICMSHTDGELDKVALRILSTLEEVERRVTTERGAGAVRFLQVDVDDVTDSLAVTSVPSLVYFKSGDPVVYDGKTLFIIVIKHTLKCYV